MPEPDPAAEAECRLLGGPPAWFAQLVLGLIAMSALVYKRHKERPQRPFDVWGFDVAKQVLSMVLAHICGMTIAAIVAAEGHRIVSECAWYFVAFSFDTTLGVALTLSFHNVAVKLARQHAAEHSFAARVADCGHYGVPAQWTNFWPQILEWLLAVLLARLSCGIVVSVLKTWLGHIARVLDVVFDRRPVALLYFVMICCPLLMNLFQGTSYKRSDWKWALLFCICKALVQDMALKWRKRSLESPHDTDDMEKGASIGLIPIRADSLH